VQPFGRWFDVIVYRYAHLSLDKLMQASQRALQILLGWRWALVIPKKFIFGLLTN
jgi:hypothetical protein